MRRAFLVAVAVAVVAGVSGAAGSGIGGVPGGTALPAGEIVFTRSVMRNGWRVASSLYVMDAAGSHVQLFVRNASNAAVSRDGRRIAFVRRGAVWVMRRDGSGQRQLTHPGAWHPDLRYPGGRLTEDDNPAWSPDGRAVYFDRFFWKSTTGELWSIASDGSRLRRLVRGQPETGTGGYGSCAGDPAASPDGRLIAFDLTSDCVHGEDTYIYAVTRSGRKAKLPFRLPGGKVIGTITAAPAWSPDGSRLAYEVLDIDATAKIGASGIYVSSANGSPPTRILKPGTPQDLGAPAWSTEGDWIAYTKATEARASDIWLARTDGSDARAIAATRADEDDPAWLPTGDKAR